MSRTGCPTNPARHQSTPARSILCPQRLRTPRAMSSTQPTLYPPQSPPPLSPVVPSLNHNLASQRARRRDGRTQTTGSPADDPIGVTAITHPRTTLTSVMALRATTPVATATGTTPNPRFRYLHRQDGTTTPARTQHKYIISLQWLSPSFSLPRSARRRCRRRLWSSLVVVRMRTTKSILPSRSLSLCPLVIRSSRFRHPRHLKRPHQTLPPKNPSPSSSVSWADRKSVV